MNQHIGYVSLLVPDYDEAIAHYTQDLGFTLVENTDLGEGRRWVLVAPPGSRETRLVLAQAKSEQERAAIGNQCGGRVFLFLHTDSFERDHERFRTRGIRFLETPRHEAYGTVAVFCDKFGNKWDLLELKNKPGSH